MNTSSSAPSALTSEALWYPQIGRPDDCSGGLTRCRDASSADHPSLTVDVITRYAQKRASGVVNRAGARCLRVPRHVLVFAARQPAPRVSKVWTVHWAVC